ncbi:MAG: nucleotidyltransferase family protein [Elusimicrobia bacterium]|nr:nucleotidyltransferase family protein [Elusimicrobiota bacterium]
MKPPRSYLLAAGRGSRAGGPKAWLESEGRPLLARQLEFLLGMFPPDAVAVSVQEGWLDRCRALNADVRWVPVDPDASPLAALKALLAASPLESWAFLHHVDMPVWDGGLWGFLASFASGSEEAPEAVVPAYGGRGGHPVLLSPRLAGGLAALDPERDRLDVWLRSRRVRRIEVPYPCAVENWNEGVRG